MPPGVQVVRLHEAEAVVARLVQEEQAGVGRRPGKDLLVAKVDDLGQVLALGNQLAQRLAVLGLEELVRQDEAQPPAARSAAPAPARQRRRRCHSCPCWPPRSAACRTRPRSAPTPSSSGCGCTADSRSPRRTRPPPSPPGTRACQSKGLTRRISSSSGSSRPAK